MIRKISLVVGLIAVSMLFSCAPAKTPKKSGEKGDVSAKSPNVRKILKIAKALVKEKGNMNQGYDSRFRTKNGGIPILVWAVSFSAVDAVKLESH